MVWTPAEEIRWVYWEREAEDGVSMERGNGEGQKGGLWMW